MAHKKTKTTSVKPLNAVKKAGKVRRQTIYSDIQERAVSARRIILLKVENPRNEYLTNIRTEMRKLCPTSTVLFGKTKLVQSALGTTADTEVVPGISELTNQMTGLCGIVCTGAEVSDVEHMLANQVATTYARSGQEAIETIVLNSSASLEHFPPSMEVRLRELGMPTILKDAKIELVNSYTMATAGQPLTTQQCQVLKLFNKKMSVFTPTVVTSFDIPQAA